MLSEGGAAVIAEAVRRGIEGVYEAAFAAGFAAGLVAQERARSGEVDEALSVEAVRAQVERLPDDVPGRVMVFGHSSEAHAAVSAHRNRADYGHPAWHEQRAGRWVTVVDLRPRIEALDRRVPRG